MPKQSDYLLQSRRINHASSRANLILRLIIIKLILIICILFKNSKNAKNSDNSNNSNSYTAFAGTTKTELDELILSDDEIDERILRDLSNINFDDFSHYSEELSMDEFMTPEEQKEYMAQIHNIINSREQASKPSSSSLANSNPTNMASDKLLEENNIIVDLLKNVPDHDLSVLINLISASGEELEAFEAKSIEERQNMISKIVQILPGAQITSKWYRLDDQYPDNDANYFLSNDDEMNSIRRKAHDILQEQVEITLGDIDEEIQDTIESMLEKSGVKDISNIKDEDIEKMEEKIRDHISLTDAPCMDLYPKRCRVMKSNGHCSKVKYQSYMLEHCPMSCDVCNAQIQKDMTGVPQDLMMDEALAQIPKKQKSMPQLEENLSITRRIRILLTEMAKYYEKGLQSKDEDQKAIFHMCKNRYTSCAKWAIQGVCEMKPELMAISCGPACRLCHFKPEYETVSSSNKKNDDNGTICSPNDHDCISDNNNKNNNNGKNNDLDGQMALSFGTSPFVRRDLQGVFEAIEGSRIVRGWNGITVTATSNGNNNGTSPSWHRFVSLKQFTPILYRPNDSHYYKAHSLKSNPSNRHPIHSKGPVIAQFDTFLSAKECGYLLELVKSLRIGGRTDFDGFGAHTTDASIVEDTKQSGKFHIIRTSSRKYFYPYDDDLDSVGGNNDSNVQYPIIEQIFNRIELITGAPRSHIEVPLQFDKFIRNQYHEGQRHSVQQSMSEQTLKNIPLLKKKGNSFSESETTISSSTATSLLIPSYPNVTEEEEEEEEEGKHDNTSKNPRVLCLTVFLNEDGLSGGDLIFPRLPNIRIKPKMGRAVLYPAVMSLDDLESDEEDEELTKEAQPPAPPLETSTSTLASSSTSTSSTKSVEERLVTMKMIMEGDGMEEKSWDEVAMIAGTAFEASGAAFEHTSNGKVTTKNSDKTIIAHMKVKNGIKYVVTFYLRLNPFLDHDE